MADTRPLPGAAASSQRRATPAAMRALLDALLQSSTVELFRSRGVAAAPTPPTGGGPRLSALVNAAGMVGLNAPKTNGSLSLAWADPVFSLFSPPVPPSSRGGRDLLRELTNQLAGRVKNRLLNFGVRLSVGVPTVLSGPAFERQRARPDAGNVYGFRTLRGEILVTFELALDPEALSYAGGTRVAEEGDFIPF